MQAMRYFSKSALAAGVLFAAFAVNVCIGKYRVWSGSGTSAPLDGVPEFLILLAAVALFVAIALAAERRAKAPDERGA